MLSFRLSYTQRHRRLQRCRGDGPVRLSHLKESLPDQFFVRTGPFSLTYTAVPGEVQRWGTCDYEASEPPFSSVWPVRAWLPFGKIHFNPTFFIPHRPFLIHAPGASFRDRSGAHGVTIITCRLLRRHILYRSSLSLRCAPPLRAGHLPSAVRGLPI